MEESEQCKLMTVPAGLIPEVDLDPEQIDLAMHLASAGVSASRIASALRLDPSAASRFTALSENPLSHVARMLAIGREHGRALPIAELARIAQSGDPDVIKVFEELRESNQFETLMSRMDDDELS